MSDDENTFNFDRTTVYKDQKAYPAPIPYISEVTNSGKVIIIFTRALQEIPSDIDLKSLEYEVEPGVLKPAFKVEIVPAEAQEPENVAMEWSIVHYSAG